MIRLFAEAFVDSCVFDGNTATNSGGALYMRSHGMLSLKDTAFINNQALGM